MSVLAIKLDYLSLTFEDRKAEENRLRKVVLEFDTRPSHTNEP